MAALPKDPAMLLSAVNMKLRDFYDSLDALCDDLDVARESIETSLAGIGYTYDAEKNQFVHGGIWLRKHGNKNE